MHTHAHPAQAPTHPPTPTTPTYPHTPTPPPPPPPTHPHHTHITTPPPHTPTHTDTYTHARARSGFIEGGSNLCNQAATPSGLGIPWGTIQPRGGLSKEKFTSASRKPRQWNTRQTHNKERNWISQQPEKRLKLCLSRVPACGWQKL